MGTSAKGALIGIPIKEYIILDLCSPCLSVPSVRKSSRTLSCGISVDGNDTSTFSLPDNSSVSLRLESGGIDLSPHSSYGILFKAWLP